MSNTIIIKGPEDYPRMKMALQKFTNQPPTIQKPRAYKSCCSSETVPVNPPNITEQLSQLQIVVHDDETMNTVESPSQPTPKVTHRSWYRSLFGSW